MTEKTLLWLIIAALCFMVVLSSIALAAAQLYRLTHPLPYTCTTPSSNVVVCQR